MLSEISANVSLSHANEWLLGCLYSARLCLHTCELCLEKTSLDPSSDSEGQVWTIGTISSVVTLLTSDMVNTTCVLAKVASINALVTSYSCSLVTKIQQYIYRRKKIFLFFNSAPESCAPQQIIFLYLKRNRRTRIFLFFFFSRRRRIFWGPLLSGA